VGSLTEPPIQLQLNSGANISLISEEFYKLLSLHPKLQKGMKLKLFQLTNKAKILGYVVLSIFIPMTDGRTLKLREELYIIPGMNIPILLGEDFQVNYQISVHRTAQETTVSILQPGDTFVMPASSTPHLDMGFAVQPTHHKEVCNQEAYLTTVHE
jgi:hypothetical protein